MVLAGPVGARLRHWREILARAGGTKDDERRAGAASAQEDCRVMSGHAVLEQSLVALTPRPLCGVGGI